QLLPESSWQVAYPCYPLPLAVPFSILFLSVNVFLPLYYSKENLQQDDSHYRLSSNYCTACAAVINAKLYTSSALHPRDKSLTGLFNPCKIGPTASNPPNRWAIL